MRRPITIAITVTLLSLLALIVWELGLDVTENDAAVAKTKRPEYSMTNNPYLPIQRLRPVY